MKNTILLVEAVKSTLMREDLGPELHAQLTDALMAHDFPDVADSITTLRQFLNALDVQDMPVSEALNYIADALGVLSPEFADIQNDNGTVSESSDAEARSERFENFNNSVHALRSKLFEHTRKRGF